MPQTPMLTRLTYGAPAGALALIGVTFYVYLPKFYSDVVGLSLGWLSAIILFSRIWDAITDPLIGYLSDRLVLKGGRRLPWIKASVIPLGFFFYLVCVPPEQLSTTAAIWWFAMTSFLFFFFWTTFAVPYEALGAELTEDYHERTAVFSWREGALVAGTLFCALIPELLKSLPQRDLFFYLGILYPLILAISALLCVKHVKERAAEEIRRPDFALFKNVKLALQNRPFVILLTAYTISGFGGALPATLMLYYVQYVLHSDKTNIFLALYFSVGFFLIPLWVKLAGRIGKKQAWLSAMAVNTGAFALVLILGAGDELWYGILVSLSGLGYGGTLVIPSSMQADVYDYDEWKHGARREAQFVGLWSIARKLSAALGTSVALFVLDSSGYQPNAVQTEGTILALTLLYASVPCITNIISIGIAWRYPINAELYRKIKEDLPELRKRGKEQQQSV